MTKINTKVTKAIVIGQKGYGTHLLIGPDGDVDPAAKGATSITGPAGVAGVVIRNEGTIVGGHGKTAGVAINLYDDGKIINSGFIDGGAGGNGANAIDMASGTISNSGSIWGGDARVLGSGGYGVDLTAGKIVNSGDIVGGSGGRYGAGSAGVTIGGGQLTNLAGGVIVGGGGEGTDGAVYAGNGVDITNAGTIIGYGGLTYGGLTYGGVGIDFREATGSDTLVNTGVIYGDYSGAGVISAHALYITNSGTIAGGSGGYGIASGGGTITNTGTISGASFGGSSGEAGWGVRLGSGTLDAAGGVIAGDPNASPFINIAVQFGDSGNGTLEVSPSATFIGGIYGSTAVSDVLDLQAGSTAGTLAGIGTTVTGFSATTVESNADWKLTGTLSAGAVSIGSAATLQFYGTASAGIIFASGGDATLVLGNPANVSSVFSGFGTGDQIDLVGITATKLSYSAGTLTLFNAGGSVVDTLHFSGDYTKSDFALQTLANGTAVVYSGTDTKQWNDPLQDTHFVNGAHIWP